MIKPIIAIGIIFVYMAILFVIALVVERKYLKGKDLSNHAFIYVLALAIYCTTWTFYGNVGLAATDGFLYLGVYIGPTLIIIFWWQILRKMIRLKNEHRLTSIADFLSARYNKSQAVAAIATVIALVGIMPYIALQLKAVITSFAQITAGGALLAPMRYYVDFIIVAMMIIFTIIFGFRRSDMSERHPGMVMVVAIQSVIKLIAFLSVGIFVVYFLFHGFSDLFGQFQRNAQLINNWRAGAPSYSLWMTYTILSMAAIMLLPRQFHMAVIENTRERHIRAAMWLLPLYFVLITLFSLPIALAGIMQGIDVSLADFFILILPQANGAPLLSLLVFIGGFSAAASMIMISTMAMAIMATNHLVLPVINKFEKIRFLQKRVMQIRWLAASGIIFTGYWFKLKLGASYALVKIGMISFAAALQFAPAMFGGLFWKKGSRQGAIWGLSAGFILWGYVSLLPAFIKSGWLPESILNNGPFNIAFLKPEQLFGISALDPLTLTVFLSMFFNIGFYVLASLLSSRGQEEKRIAAGFVDILNKPEDINPANLSGNINIESKIKIAKSLLALYIKKSETEKLIGKIMEKIGLKEKKRITILDLAKFSGGIEKALSGHIGSASGKEVLKNSGLITENEAGELSRVYGKLIADLKISPKELVDKIDYYKELEKIYKKQSSDLSNQVNEKTREMKKLLENLKLDKEDLEKQRIATLNILEDVSDSQAEIKKTYQKLNEKSRELSALKSLSDELAGALSVSEAVTIVNVYLSKFFETESVIYFVLNPFEEGMAVFRIYLNKEVSEKYAEAAQKAFCNKISAQKDKNFKQALPVVKTIKPEYLGKKLDNSNKNLPDSYLYFSIKIGEKKLGIIQATINKNRPLKPEEKELISAFLSAAALTIDRFQTLELVSHSKTTSLIESLTDGVVMFSVNEDVLLANPAFSAYTGLSGEKLKMSGLYKLLPFKETRTMVKDAIDSGKLSRLNEVLLNGKYYEAFITSVKDNQEKIVGGAVIFHDITYLKEMDRMKTEFVSVASHQLRTPLTAIKLFVDMLISGEVGKINKEQSEYLVNVRESTERMIRLVNDLLNVTRIESGHLSVSPQPLDIKLFIKNIIAEAKPLAEARKQKMIYSGNKALLSKIPIDQNLMRQVVHNLLINAIRYSPKEKGEIEIALLQKDKDKFIISVKDNGFGIPEESKGRIFEKFYRADNAIKAVTEGTGLGLYVSKMIVESSGGKIWFDSEANKGTAFFVELPIKGMKEKRGERGLAIS